MSNNINNSIIKSIASYDSAGTSSGKIDTLLEFNKLGEYLSSGYVEENSNYRKLSKKEMSLLQTVYNSIKDTFAKLTGDDNELPQINKDNALEYAKIADKLLYTASNDTDKAMCDKMQKALYKFANDNGYDLSEYNYNECNYPFIMKQVQEIIKTNEERDVQAQKMFKSINEPHGNSKLEKSLQEFLQTRPDIKPLDETNTEIDLGNGKFDRVATQNTNVCWALASINALLTTEEGKNLLENNSYYDEKTGVFAIHLQEAEDNNFHGGVYFITPDDIRAEGGALAEGEGDATAYLIAVKRYFEEVNQNPELAQQMEEGNHTVRNMEDGNYGFRFFEILTGSNCSKYNFNDNDKPFHNGIGTSTPDIGSFKNICDIVANKKGAATIAVAGHSISVVDVREGKLIVQESNNSDDFSKEYSDLERNHVIFNRIEDINGAPAYELTQDDFEHYIQAFSFMQWK